MIIGRGKGEDQANDEAFSQHTPPQTPMALFGFKAVSHVTRS